MKNSSPAKRTKEDRLEWESGRLSFNSLVSRIEDTVHNFGEDVSPEVYRSAIHHWGRLEILNALSLDEGRDLTAPEREGARVEIDALLNLFLEK